MTDTEPNGANRELKMRLRAAMKGQGLSQADIVTQTQLNGEAVAKATVSNALNAEKGPPSSVTLKAILNALGISGSDREELSRLRDRADSRGDQAVVGVVGLPREPEGFVGRQDEIKELLEVLDPASGSRRTAVVVGMPGVGKSALALHAAHIAVEEGRFPGGALYVDLDGYAGEAEKKARQTPISAAHALEVMLHTMGVTSEHMPPTEPGRAALYRAKLAEFSGPAMILIDNAPTADAVKALLPGLGNHRVLVTSRHTFTSLSGARHVELKVLTVDESVELIDTALQLFNPHDLRVRKDPGQAPRQAVRATAAGIARLGRDPERRPAWLARPPGR
ncbi:AAA family ATPase [Streptomyces yerevanensis]|uniref:AAA family ATPase n=1 Tax=Streptomyces yerevanensis TaxID=66378 RepID=UPI000691C3B3|nr:AAA family ATPase [Streptomyces yerevanensis]